MALMRQTTSVVELLLFRQKLIITAHLCWNVNAVFF